MSYVSYEDRLFIKKEKALSPVEYLVMQYDIMYERFILVVVRIIINKIS